jgi:hypothetical protein
VALVTLEMATGPGATVTAQEKAMVATAATQLLAQLVAQLAAAAKVVTNHVSAFAMAVVVMAVSREHAVMKANVLV